MAFMGARQPLIITTNEKSADRNTGRLGAVHRCDATCPFPLGPAMPCSGHDDRGTAGRIGRGGGRVLVHHRRGRACAATDLGPVLGLIPLLGRSGYQHSAPIPHDPAQREPRLGHRRPPGGSPQPRTASEHLHQINSYSKPPAPEMNYSIFHAGTLILRISRSALRRAETAVFAAPGCHFALSEISISGG